MKADRLFRVILDNGINEFNLRILDEKYKLPSRAFVLESFAVNFEQLKKNLRRSQYIANSNDCDKVALLAQFYSNYLHNEHKMSQGYGVAFGSFAYVREHNNEGHMINFAVVEDEQVLFFEPQTSMEVILTKKEKDELCISATI